MLVKKVENDQAGLETNEGATVVSPILEKIDRLSIHSVQIETTS